MPNIAIGSEYKAPIFFYAIMTFASVPDNYTTVEVTSIIKAKSVYSKEGE